MIALRLAALAMAAGLLASPAHATAYAEIAPANRYVTRPDPEFMKDTTVVVQTHTENMDEVCRGLGGQRSDRVVLVACTITSPTRQVIHMANPCLYSDPYAQVLCHEIGHTEGYMHPVQ